MKRQDKLICAIVKETGLFIALGKVSLPDEYYKNGQIDVDIIYNDLLEMKERKYFTEFHYKRGNPGDTYGQVFKDDWEQWEIRLSPQAIDRYNYINMWFWEKAWSKQPGTVLSTCISIIAIIISIISLIISWNKP